MMSDTCRLTINGKTITAECGETLVDAALAGRLLIPHDCCSGQCETCRVHIVSGMIDAQGTAERDTVLACMAQLAGDVAIRFDEVPDVVREQGTVTAISWLSADVMEVIVALRAPITYLPGQYANVAFAGFPGRDYSPAPRADGSLDPAELVLHVRRLPDGIVSSELGRRIMPGHKVKVRGPHGNAFHRNGSGRLVLVAGGTGWAPIWAVARASRLSEPGREITIIVGSRDRANLYMRPSLAWLRARGVSDIVMTSELGARGDALTGRPSDYLPILLPTDIVYVAGAQGLVNAVKHKALAADAVCYADPFLPSGEKPSLFGRVARFLRGPAALAPSSAVMSPRPAQPPVPPAQPGVPAQPPQRKGEGPRSQDKASVPFVPSRRSIGRA
jgi:NAD(P)H-flavin reductase/ferredoxin